MGFFNRAEVLYSRPIGLFALPLNKLFLPRMSFLQDDRVKLLSFINRSTWFVSFILLPVSVIIMAFGDWIVVILLGANWSPSGEVIRWIALAQIPFLLINTLFRAMAGIGKPAVTLPLDCVFLVLTCAGLIYYAPMGVVPVAKFLAVSRLALFPFHVIICLRGSGILWTVYVGSLLRLSAFTAILTLFWLFLRSQVLIESLVWQTTVLLGVLLTTYVLFYLLFRTTEIGTDVIDLVRKRLKGAFPG